MKFKSNFLSNYLKKAPAALAVERTLECEILSKQLFERPILDVGCGEGLFAYILFDEQIDTGIEPNKGEIDLAKSNGMYNELINCYGDSIPKESGVYRTVFSNSVLEHILELAPVLQEINRVMFAGGMFYVTVPSNNFDKYTWIYRSLSLLGLSGSAEKFRVYFNRFWRHYHYYDVEGWKQLFIENGFEVVDVKLYDEKKTCLLNDLMSMFALPNFVCKKLLNRWFLYKKIRYLYVPLLSRMLTRFVAADKNTGESGLIFFYLRKPFN